jgi:hypothetical protein
MFSNCSNSCCQFFKNLFRINTRKIGSYNVIINSNDLNKYLFADERELCKNKNTKKGKHLNYRDCTKNEDLGIYEAPPFIGSCDSFQSVNSDGDTDSDLSNEEVVNIDKIR